MSSLQAQSAGGKARALLQKQEAQERIAVYNANPHLCENCTNPILHESDQPLRSTLVKRFCTQPCATIYNNRRRRKRSVEVVGPKPRRPQLGTVTKGELFRQRSSWQSARSSIRRHAAQRYVGPYECRECGYAEYTEVCHIRSVSDFPDTAMIDEINSPANLIRLCPNHHWEHDHL